MKETTLTEALSAYKPDRPVFVISCNQNSRPNGMIANWHMRCSGEPALYAVCLSIHGNTHKLIEESKEFVVAVPAKNMEKALMYFGTHHGDQCDKFTETSIAISKASKVKSPLLSEATINLECHLQQIIPTGDHNIYIGKIVASHLNDKQGILLETKKSGDQRNFIEYQ